ncbi:hypothetical protein [Candidatus Cardinium sp. TP]|nr:hypothetical protein [Candidatus Cardinium sp. TP]MDN5247188.1 hypothetical protein [Candidatus Cardinium sp.]
MHVSFIPDEAIPKAIYTGMCSANGLNLRNVFVDFQIKVSICAIG